MIQKVENRLKEGSACMKKIEEKLDIFLEIRMIKG